MSLYKNITTVDGTPTPIPVPMIQPSTVSDQPSIVVDQPSIKTPVGTTAFIIGYRRKKNKLFCKHTCLIIVLLIVLLSLLFCPEDILHFTDSMISFSKGIIENILWSIR